MGNGLARELQEVKPAEPEALPTRDVRASNVPVLGGLIRFETVRRGGRVLGLAGLDVAGMFLAIWTALAIKTRRAAARPRGPAVRRRRRTYAPLACLVMLLLFARSGLYRDRPQRPGFATVISSLFQVTVVIAHLRGDRGLRVLLVLHLLRLAVLRADLRVVASAGLFERASGRAAARGRLPPPRGAGGLGLAHRRGRARAAREQRRRGVRLRVALHALAATSLRDFGSLENLERNFDAIDEVLIADPAFPQERGVRAGRPLPPPGRARAGRARRRWRS